jgi:alkaline phosphatase D
MRVSEAKELIKSVASKNVHVPILLVGSMGIGKSWIVKQVAQELGVNLIDLRLAQQEPGDLIGIPRERDGKTVWAKPDWWPEEGTKGILFLDELNRGPVDVRQAVFQLVNEWRMHTHKLPDGWYIVAAINPDNVGYQVETLDPAMLRRFCVLKVSHDVETWLTWAHGPGKINDGLTGFVGAHKQLLGVSESFEIELKPTPDQYRMLNDLMSAHAIPNREVETEVFTGLVGREAAIALRRFLDSRNKPITGKEILEGYEKVKVRVKKQANDEMYATVIDVISELQNQNKPQKKQVENLVQFIKDVTAEIKASLIQKLPKPWLAELIPYKEVTADITRILAEAGDK